MATIGNRPQRTCVACRRSKAQDELVRYVVAPDGTLLVDYRHRLPGRGAYTCIDLNCLRKAVEGKQFQRSFRGRCREVIYESLAEELQQSVRQKMMNLLGMGRKSDQLISGSNAVRTALRQGKGVALVIMTEDISSAIAEKIRASAERQKVTCCQLFGKGMLGQILGKGERSVVAVQTGTLANALLLELQRYTHMVREN